MHTWLCFISVVCLLTNRLHAQADTTGSLRRFGATLQSGFIIPHSRELRPLSQTTPVGFELTYSRLRLSRRTWETCNCFARTGGYLSFMDYNNAAVLGRMLSVGGFFEPLLWHGRRTSAGVRATGGLAYLTRVYDLKTNPDNIFFSSPVSALLALHLTASYRLTTSLDLTASATYNHISNGGIRQPNKGMNFPTLGVGLVWQPQRPHLPNYQRDRTPLNRRWEGRAQVFASANVLPATGQYPEMPKPLLGAALTGLYRLNRFHALSIGSEAVLDEAVRERIRRDVADRRSLQVGVLAGYELRQGRYRFGLQLGYNALHPGNPYTDRVYQRYQLLYTFGNRFSFGAGLRAVGHVAKGFDVRAGVDF